MLRLQKRERREGTFGSAALQLVLEPGLAAAAQHDVEAVGEAGAEQGEVDVGGPPAVDVVAEGVRAGLDGAKRVRAGLIRERAPAAAEVWVDRGEVGVVAMPVASAGVGLPELKQRVGNAAAVFVQHTTVDDDALA